MRGSTEGSTPAGMVTWTWRDRGGAGEGKHLARATAGHHRALEQCEFAAGPKLGIKLEEVPVAPRTLLWQQLPITSQLHELASGWACLPPTLWALIHDTSGASIPEAVSGQEDPTMWAVSGLMPNISLE